MGGGGWSTPREPKEPQPGSIERPQHEIFPNKGPTKFPPVKDQLLLENYKNLRFETHEIEEIIAAAEIDPDFSEQDIKRLDKAVTVMKAGFKMLKKAIRKRGILNTKVLMDAG